MKRFTHITPLGTALGNAMSEFGLERDLKQQEGFVRWEELVGTAIANYAQPSKLHQGKLWIRVTNAVWRQELMFMRTELIAKINAGLEYPVVQDVILR
jgi:predicted nucleic acid-binding Zn ribbon protein